MRKRLSDALLFIELRNFNQCRLAPKRKGDFQNRTFSSAGTLSSIRSFSSGSSYFKKFCQALKPQQTLDSVLVSFCRAESGSKGPPMPTHPSGLLAFLSPRCRPPAAVLKAVWRWEASPKTGLPSPHGTFPSQQASRFQKPARPKPVMFSCHRGWGTHLHLQ